MSSSNHADFELRIGEQNVQDQHVCNLSSHVNGTSTNGQTQTYVQLMQNLHDEKGISRKEEGNQTDQIVPDSDTVHNLLQTSCIIPKNTKLTLRDVVAYFYSYFPWSKTEDEPNEGIKIIADYIRRLKENLKERTEELTKKDKFIKIQEGELQEQITAKSNVEEKTREASEKSRNLEKEVLKLTETNNNLQKLLTENTNRTQNLEEELRNCQSQLTQTVQREQNLRDNLGNLRNTVKYQTENLVSKQATFKSNFYQYQSAILICGKEITSADVEYVAECQQITKSVEKIEQIRSNAGLYENQIKAFKGSRNAKTYLHINEMLFRIIEELDKIESQQKEEIKGKRREAILYVKQLQEELEARVDES